MQEAYDRAESILTEHRDQLDGLAALLIEREKLDREEFECFMAGQPLPDAKPVPTADAPAEAETPAESKEE